MKRVALVVGVATVSVLSLVPIARAGGPEDCSNARLRGSFGYTATGTLLPEYVPPPLSGPFAEVGRQTFDGNGNTEATATLSANGNVFGVTVAGTYVVNPACTGAMTLTVSFPDGSEATVHADFVIVDDGAEVRSLGTDQGVVESRVYKKQLRGNR